MDEEIIVRDSNGTPLKEGDSVTIIKDLKVKGSSSGLKRGTVIKNIRLNPEASEQVEGSGGGIKGLSLKAEYLKKV